MRSDGKTGDVDVKVLRERSYSRRLNKQKDHKLCDSDAGNSIVEPREEVSAASSASTAPSSLKAHPRQLGSSLLTAVTSEPPNRSTGRLDISPEDDGLPASHQPEHQQDEPQCSYHQSPATNCSTFWVDAALSGPAASEGSRSRIAWQPVCPCRSSMEHWTSVDVSTSPPPPPQSLGQQSLQPVSPLSSHSSYLYNSPVDLFAEASTDAGVSLCLQSTVLSPSASRVLETSSSSSLLYPAASWSTTGFHRSLYEQQQQVSTELCLLLSSAYSHCGMQHPIFQQRRLSLPLLQRALPSSWTTRATSASRIKADESVAITSALFCA